LKRFIAHHALGPFAQRGIDVACAANFAFQVLQFTPNVILMSGLEQGCRGIDALLGGFEIIGKIEAEREAQGYVRFGDETAILRVLGGVERFAGEFAGELRRGDTA